MINKLTVIIPCRNEVKFITECIEAIYACQLPESIQMKVFVIDGMSDDGTRELVLKLTEIYPNLFLVNNPNRMTPFAFNIGIHEGGKVDFVQIVGARHILSENYLFESLNILKTDESIWCVGGKIINEFINENGLIISKVMSTTLGMGIGNFRTLNKSGFTDTVTSPMYPFWVFEKIGYFDENLVRNQDDDFNFRITNAGGKIYYENGISLKYYVRGDYKNLWRQFYQYGYWKVFVNRKHKTITTLRQLAPISFVMYLLILPITLVVSTELFAFLSSFLIIYLILVSWFSIRINNRTSKNSFIKTWITFPTLHISYGLGFIKGIIQFIILNKKPSENQKRLSR